MSKNYKSLSDVYLAETFAREVPLLPAHDVLHREKAGMGGAVYEHKISQLIQSVIEDFSLSKVKINRRGSAFSNVGADVRVEADGIPFNVEVKMNKNAQMGSTSVRMDATTGKVEIVDTSSVDSAVLPVITKAAQSRLPALQAYIKYIKKCDPVELHSLLQYRVPTGKIAVTAWDKAAREGLLSDLNVRLRDNDVSTIIKHYNSKDCYYIQLGGLGLYYLGTDIQGIGVPEFKGICTIECRLGPSGSRSIAYKGAPIPIRTATYRITPKLQSSDLAPSNLNLESPQDVKKILMHLLNNKSRKKGNNDNV